MLRPTTSSLSLLFLLLLSLAITSEANINVRFLHIFPGIPTPLDIYWIANDFPYSCTVNFTRACSLVLPIPAGTEYSLLVVNPEDNAQLWNSTETYEAQTDALTFIAGNGANSSRFDMLVLPVPDQTALLGPNKTVTGIFANFFAIGITSAVDTDRKIQLGGEIAPFSAATAMSPLPDVFVDRVVFSLADGSQYAFGDIIPGNHINGTISILTLFPGPPGDINLAVYDLNSSLTRLALRAALPPPPHHKWPVSVIVIAAVLGVSGFVTLVSCIVTWIQDVQLARNKAGYQPVE